MKKRMFCLLLILLLAGVAYGQTYDSKITPSDLEKWDVVEAGICPDGQAICVLVSNPDKEAEYSEAMIVVHPQSHVVLAYILRHGQEYEIYKLERNNHYGLVRLKNELQI